MPIFSDLTFEARDAATDGLVLCGADDEEIGVGELYASMDDGTVRCAEHYVEHLQGLVTQHRRSLTAADSLLKMAYREIGNHDR